MDFQQNDHLYHISSQFNSELQGVKSDLLEMGGVVEQQLHNSITALISADSKLAQHVINLDEKVNTMELEIDDRCASILALRQPAASDLRLVIAVTKAVNDLERIGDESTKIASLAMKLAEIGEAPRGYKEVRQIGEGVRQMTNNALTAFARMDAEAALAIVKADKQIDLEYSAAMRELVTVMMNDPAGISRIMNIIWALRALERVGDHARNLAEDVIYLIKGVDVRHIPYSEIEKQVHAEPES